MSKASTFVKGIPHEDFLKILGGFCQRKEVTHLMTYGIDYIDASEIAAVKQSIASLGYEAKTSDEVDEFCRAIHARAVREQG